MRLSDGPVHRLVALLGSLFLCSCSPPLTPPSPFHTSAVRFTGASLITTDAAGHVTVIGNADHVDVGDASTLTVIGNGLHVRGACALQALDLIGNGNVGHLGAR